MPLFLVGKVLCCVCVCFECVDEINYVLVKGAGNKAIYVVWGIVEERLRWVSVRPSSLHVAHIL